MKETMLMGQKKSLAQYSGKNLSQYPGERLSQYSGENLSQYPDERLSQYSSENLSQYPGERLPQYSEEYLPQYPGVWAGQPVRTYKDRVFRMIFKEKESFLELYNAMNRTAYTNLEDLTVTTLENAIYLSMKNDVSYLLYDRLALYEHQSTRNPNLPLRDLFYVANIFSRLTYADNLYGTKLVKIPEPVFVVFYNGKEEMPERSVLRLSDAYEQPSDDPALELKVLVLNINPGYNKELMENCKKLRDYSIFTNKIREYRELLPLSQAVEKAIQDCIAEDVLKEFLQKNRAEVLNVSIFEYNEELHMQQERREAMEEGLLEGLELGQQKGEFLLLINLIKKKRARNFSAEEIANFLEEDVSRIKELAALIDSHPEKSAEELYEILNTASSMSAI